MASKHWLGGLTACLLAACAAGPAAAPIEPPPVTAERATMIEQAGALVSKANELVKVAKPADPTLAHGLWQSVGRYAEGVRTAATDAAARRQLVAAEEQTGRLEALAKQAKPLASQQSALDAAAAFNREQHDVTGTGTGYAAPGGGSGGGGGSTRGRAAGAVGSYNAATGARSQAAGAALGQ